jgi:hypothetical protein
MARVAWGPATPLAVVLPLAARTEAQPIDNYSDGQARKYIL